MMTRRRLVSIACAAVYAGALASVLGAGSQMPDTFFDDASAPTVAYATRQPNDPIARLNGQLAAGSGTLAYDTGGSGYLGSVLKALRIPVESQLAVFSKTSVQAPIISPANPRTLFFNDEVVVGWPRGGFIEAAAVDPELGVIFYSLQQRVTSAPRFERGVGCTSCHLSLEGTLSIPGMLLRSEPTLADGRVVRQLGHEIVDHRLPIGKRWGGFYVTGRSTGVESLANVMLDGPFNSESTVAPQTIQLTTLKDRFPGDGYLSPYSDVAALLVFDHQVRMTNLLARLSWEARAAEGESNAASVIDAVVREVVDYMLFVDESPLMGRVEGNSGFAEWFSAQGPADSRGRSLRQLDLTRRLLRYPCSYMIYTDAFNALPKGAHDAVYRRLWAVLSGQDPGPRYARLTAEDRQAVIEILRATKNDLPDYFR
jgi:hypothetical protein